jgi:demethylmenaquinone methyltransferase/2-methoxy-6-polyprenyl-1,4-benzoquinol methylase
MSESPDKHGSDKHGSNRHDSRPGTTHFGFRDVPTVEKQKMVGQVFSSVASKYDLMNGDIALLLRDRVGDTGSIVLGDINGSMLRVGRDRMTDMGKVAGFEYVQMNAEKLPFPDGSFDLVTIAFGLRNVTDKDAALREMHRVLKVGGQARVLEFSEVKAQWFKPIYDFHSFKVLPKLGSLFAGDADSYQYLAESIRKHPPQDELKTMMQAAGFARCDYRNLSAGIVAIHTGYKV